MRYPANLARVLILILSAATVGFAADVEGLPGGKAPEDELARKCLNDILAFEKELSRVGFGVLQPGGHGSSTPPGYSDYYVFGVEATPRKKMLALRDAAYVYAFAGDEQSCQRELASMRAVYEQHQTLVGTESDQPDIRRAWRRAHLSRAKPVAKMNHLMRADVLIGSEVRNFKDERLGEIRDIVFNPEKRELVYLLVSRGGFLGIGEKLVAMRWNDLRATEDHELYVLDVSPKAFDDAPAVDRHNFTKTANPEWRLSLDRYWDDALK